MATEESYVPSNKRMKSDELSFVQPKPEPSMPITSDEDGSDRKLPEENFKPARINLAKAMRGLDVPELPPCDLLNPLQPVNIDSPDDCYDFEAYSQHLEFVKILKVLSHGVSYATFYHFGR